MNNIYELDSLCAYIGGKRYLAKTISKYIKNTPHRLYGEVFFGMGSVFLRKGFKSKVEVINDINKDIYNLFKVLRKHYPEVERLFEFNICSREEFLNYLKVNPDSLTDIERAVRFVYLQKLRFGGNPLTSSFAVGKNKDARFKTQKMLKQMKLISNRLDKVIIENLDFEKFIKSYDSEQSLFYLDPPYYNFEKYYGKDIFSKKDFERLNNCLDNIKGKFILSINNCDEIRELFKNFYIKEVKTRYCIKTKNDVKELLIFNYDCKEDGK